MVSFYDNRLKDNSISARLLLNKMIKDIFRMTTLLKPIGSNFTNVQMFIHTDII